MWLDPNLIIGSLFGGQVIFIQYVQIEDMSFRHNSIGMLKIQVFSILISSLDRLN